MPDLSGAAYECRTGTAKNFTLLLLLYITQPNIEGASQVGIYPVWYDNDTDKDYKDRSNEHLPQCEYLHIHEWNEMIDLLERIKI